jgi:hypothetical protein
MQLLRDTGEAENDGKRRQRDLFLSWFDRSASMLSKKDLDPVLGMS